MTSTVTNALAVVWTDAVDGSDLEAVILTGEDPNLLDIMGDVAGWLGDVLGRTDLHLDHFDVKTTEAWGLPIAGRLSVRDHAAYYARTLGSVRFVYLPAGDEHWCQMCRDFQGRTRPAVARHLIGCAGE